MMRGHRPPAVLDEDIERDRERRSHRDAFADHDLLLQKHRFVLSARFGSLLKRRQRTLPIPVEVIAQPLQCVRFETVNTPGALGSITDQTRFFQHPQMHRNGGAPDRHAVRKRRDIERTRRQPADDAPPGSIAKRFERGIDVGGHISSVSAICQR